MYGKTLTQEEITTNGGDPSKVAVVKAGPAPRVNCMLPPSIACTAAVVVVSTILTSRPCLAKRFSFWAMKYKLVPGLTPAWPTVIFMVGQAGVNPGTSLYFIAQKENQTGPKVN